MQGVDAHFALAAARQDVLAAAFEACHRELLARLGVALANQRSVHIFGLPTIYYDAADLLCAVIV